MKMLYGKMKKRVCALTAALAVLPLSCLSPVTAFAVGDFPEQEIKTFEGLQYYEAEGGTGVIISGFTDDMAANLVIPAEIDGKPVTGFAQFAFYRCEKLTEVTIPDTIHSFGMQTFLSCPNLKAVHLPDGLESIYEATFAQCTSLESITLPEGMTTLGNLVFSGCTSLKEINIPESLTEFFEPAFEDTPWLEAQKKANPYVSINGVLIDISAVPGTEFAIPDGIKAVNSYILWSDQERDITAITFPESIERIGRGALDGTSWMKAEQEKNPLVTVNGILINGEAAADGIVTVPDGIRTIGEGAFEPSYEGPSKMTGIVLPDSVTAIQKHAFRECTELKEVELSANVCVIEPYAFSFCENLDAITILNPQCDIQGDNFTISNGWDESYNIQFKGTIRGCENSTAQAYAEKYGYKFESVGKFEAPAGDMNADGKVTSADAVLLARFVSEDSTLSQEEIAAILKADPDFDKDGFVTLKDLAVLLKKL